MERIDNFSGKTNTMGIIEQFAEIKAEEGLKKGVEIGVEIGRATERELFVSNLLTNTKLSPDKIASFANVTLDFVNKVKAGIHTK